MPFEHSSWKRPATTKPTLQTGVQACASPRRTFEQVSAFRTVGVVHADRHSFDEQDVLESQG